VVLGVSYDTVAENAAFAAKFEFGFPLLSDPERTMGPAYGAGDGGNAARVGVIIDPGGAVLQWHAKVDARAFPAEALAAIPG
jgi:peroxiredoxin Q/BCP